MKNESERILYFTVDHHLQQQIASYIIALPRNYLINVISETDIFSTHHNWVQVEQ